MSDGVLLILHTTVLLAKNTIQHTQFLRSGFWLHIQMKKRLAARHREVKYNLYTPSVVYHYWSGNDMMVPGCVESKIKIETEHFCTQPTERHW